VNRRNEAIKYCRYCGHLIRQDASDCPYCERNVIRQAGVRECPFCGEPIRQKAIKCKHCGEFLDGRTTPKPAPANVVYIDKAVIAGSGEGPLKLSAPSQSQASTPEAQLPPAEASPNRRLVAAQQRALQKVAPASPPAVSPEAPKDQEPPRRGAETPPTTPEASPPPVQYQCPSCASYVFEDDNFCENCGRDLSIPAGRSEFPDRPRDYEPAEYALMLGAAAPLGLLLDGPPALCLAAAGVLLSLWCLLRMMTSRNPLLGMGSAIGGLIFGGFWLLLIGAVVF